MTGPSDHHGDRRVAWRFASLPAARRWLLVATGCCLLLSRQGLHAEEVLTRWPDEQRVGPFVCHAEFSLQGVRDVLLELVTLERDVATQLQLPPSRQPIHLFLFSHRRTYERYLKKHFPSVPLRRALFIKNGGPGMVFAYRSDNMVVDIRHECTHALLHAAFPVVPMWLDEGLAEYFEQSDSERAEQGPHLNAIKWSVRFGRVPSLENLESLADIGEMSQSQYQQAWAWVHFLLHGPPAAREELAEFLRKLSRQEPPGRLSQRLASRIPDLDRAFATHFKAWRTPSRVSSLFAP